MVGRAGVDLRLLRKHTRYCGVSPNERHIITFWKVLETFTPEELTLFIRYPSRLSLPSLFLPPFPSAAVPLHSHLPYSANNFLIFFFFRFVWGRSKLPSPNEFYTAQFQLQSFSREISNENRDPDVFLPEAQTYAPPYISPLCLSFCSPPRFISYTKNISCFFINLFFLDVSSPSPYLATPPLK